MDLFCCLNSSLIIFLSVVFHLISCQLNLENFTASTVLDKTINYNFLYNTSAVNCRTFLPSSIINYKQQVSNKHSNSQRVIPDQFLRDCLLAIEYDKNYPPFYFTENWILKFGIILNELISIDNLGNIKLKVDIFLYWTEPRMTWMPNNLFNQTWQWSLHTVLPVIKVWVPSLTIENCEDSCIIRPENTSQVVLSSNGQTYTIIKQDISGRCDLTFETFPFDSQVCVIRLTLENEEYYQDMFSVSRVAFGYPYSFSSAAFYMRDNDEWKITAYDVSRNTSNFFIFCRILLQIGQYKCRH